MRLNKINEIHIEYDYAVYNTNFQLISCFKISIMENYDNTTVNSILKQNTEFSVKNKQVIQMWSKYRFMNQY